MASTAELPPPPAPSIPSNHNVHGMHSCPACGTSIELDKGEMEMARRRIMELEAQMELLKEKATAAGMSLQGVFQTSTDMDSGQMRRLRRPNTKPQTCTRRPQARTSEHIRQLRPLTTLRRRTSPIHSGRNSCKSIALLVLHRPPHVPKQLHITTAPLDIRCPC
jgi:hypothetical protein